jgi:hypothetical protein
VSVAAEDPSVNFFRLLDHLGHHHWADVLELLVSYAFPRAVALIAAILDQTDRGAGRGEAGGGG